MSIASILTCSIPSKSRPCYTSCAAYAGGDCGYLEGSCDWTSCHDDVAYTETGTSYSYNADNTALR